MKQTKELKINFFGYDIQCKIVQTISGSNVCREAYIGNLNIQYSVGFSGYAIDLDELSEKDFKEYILRLMVERLIFEHKDAVFDY